MITSEDLEKNGSFPSEGHRLIAYGLLRIAEVLEGFFAIVKKHEGDES